MKSPSGIRAIAEALDISIATVHRALHNTGRISQTTRMRVLQMAEHIGYKPNLSARNLRLNRHFRISVHFPTTIASFFESLRAGIEQGSAPFHSAFEIEFHSYIRAPGRAQKSILAALDAGVHGIITVPPNTVEMSALVETAQERGVPVICVSSDVPESKRLTAVTAHPRCCGALAAEIMAPDVRRRSQIVILAGDLNNLNQTEKIRGFRQTLAEIAPSVTIAAVLETHDDASQAGRGIQRIFTGAQNIGGLYVSSANSIPALRVLREMGRLEGLTIVTTDLFPELIPFLRNGTVKATVYQCPEMQGTLAIQAMYRFLMEGMAPPSSIGVIPQLILRSNLDLYLHDTDTSQRIVLKAAGTDHAPIRKGRGDATVVMHR